MGGTGGIDQPLFFPFMRGWKIMKGQCSYFFIVQLWPAFRASIWHLPRSFACSSSTGPMEAAPSPKGKRVGCPQRVIPYIFRVVVVGGHGWEVDWVRSWRVTSVEMLGVRWWHWKHQGFGDQVVDFSGNAGTCGSNTQIVDPWNQTPGCCHQGWMNKLPRVCRGSLDVIRG